MKKIVLTLIAMFSMTMTFAENENMNASNAYVMNVNINSLSRSLGLTTDQKEAVREIQATFSAELLNAAAADNADRSAILKKAVKRDLAYMRAVLERDQYRKYVSILNATFINRGIVMQ